MASPRFYVIADPDHEISKRLALFSRKWGDWVRTERDRAHHPAKWLPLDLAPIPSIACTLLL